MIGSAVCLGSVAVRQASREEVERDRPSAHPLARRLNRTYHADDHDLGLDDKVASGERMPTGAGRAGGDRGRSSEDRAGSRDSRNGFECRQHLLRWVSRERRTDERSGKQKSKNGREQLARPARRRTSSCEPRCPGLTELYLPKLAGNCGHPACVTTRGDFGAKRSSAEYLFAPKIELPICAETAVISQITTRKTCNGPERDERLAVQLESLIFSVREEIRGDQSHARESSRPHPARRASLARAQHRFVTAYMHSTRVFRSMCTPLHRQDNREGQATKRA